MEPVLYTITDIKHTTKLGDDMTLSNVVKVTWMLSKYGPFYSYFPEKDFTAAEAATSINEQAKEFVALHNIANSSV